MTEIAQEGYVQEAPEAPPDTSYEDVGGWPVDGVGGWSGPSPEEWAETQQFLGAIAELLAPQQQPQGFDPFAEDGGRAQLDAMIAEHVAPLAETYSQLQQQASLATANDQISRFVTDTAEQLGATVDEAEVRQAANDDVAGLASRLMADAGYVPQQIKAVFESDPTAPFQILAGVYGASIEEVVRAALQTRIAGNDSEATRPRGPYGVLRKFTGTPVPAREMRLPADQRAFIEKNVRGRR